MSWCDKLASTPGAGIMLDRLYGPGSSMLNGVAPLMSQWVDGDKPAFTVDQQDMFGFAVSNFDGYTYLANSEWLTVEFKHHLRLRGQSAGPPVAEMLSKPQPYTALLSEVLRRVNEFSELAVSAGRKLKRIGILSTTFVDVEEIPPGLRRFLEHTAAPWGTTLDNFNIDITVKLPRTKAMNHRDRCQHQLTKREEDGGLMTIRLDYQRLFDAERPLSSLTIENLLKEVRDDALAYFEDMAEGVRFDEPVTVRA